MTNLELPSVRQTVDSGIETPLVQGALMKHIIEIHRWRELYEKPITVKFKAPGPSLTHCPERHESRILKYRYSLQPYRQRKSQCTRL